jgi:hypothetical protein
VAKFLVKLEKDVNTFQIKLEENVTKLQVMLVKDVRYDIFFPVSV